MMPKPKPDSQAMSTRRLNPEAVEALKAADLDNLTTEEEAAFAALREWISEYNLGRAPKPKLDPGLRLIVSSYAERKMDEQVFGKDYDFLEPELTPAPLHWKDKP